MQHKIPIQEIGPQGETMARAVEACVHCGFCLPTCPTYLTMGEEMDSPRGRIFLMKEVLEGALELEKAQPFIDRCLGCEACVTACPSGVEYGRLISPFRAYAENRRRRNRVQKFFRFLLMESLPYPSRFRVLARFGMTFRIFKSLLPAPLKAGLDLLPASLPKPDTLPQTVPPKGEKRARVALLTGCVQQVLAPAINSATLRVLSENGVEVVLPPGQACCGALAMHVGEAERAKETARKNLSVFPDDCDAIISNAAGCGSGMKDYSLLFKSEPEEEKAKAFVGKVIDVSAFLFQLGLRQPPPLLQPLRLAYHDACHLAHAQGERTAPRKLLASIPGLTLLDVPEWEICCGSAGTYNLEQPLTAQTLGRRKAENILATSPEAVASGNIGCNTQIQRQLAEIGHPLPVFHTMEILDFAYRRVSLSAGK